MDKEIHRAFRRRSDSCHNVRELCCWNLTEVDADAADDRSDTAGEKVPAPFQAVFI